MVTRSIFAARTFVVQPAKRKANTLWLIGTSRSSTDPGTGHMRPTTYSERQKVVEPHLNDIDSKISYQYYVSTVTTDMIAAIPSVDRVFLNPGGPRSRQRTTGNETRKPQMSVREEDTTRPFTEKEMSFRKRVSRIRASSKS